MSFKHFPTPSPGRPEQPTPSPVPERQADYDAPLLDADRKLGHIRVSTESRLIIACQATAPRCAASANASIQAKTRGAPPPPPAAHLSLATSLGSSNSPNHETGRPPAVDPRQPLTGIAIISAYSARCPARDATWV